MQERILKEKLISKIGKKELSEQHVDLHMLGFFEHVWLNINQSKCHILGLNCNQDKLWS